MIQLRDEILFFPVAKTNELRSWRKESNLFVSLCHVWKTFTSYKRDKPCGTIQQLEILSDGSVEVTIQPVDGADGFKGNRICWVTSFFSRCGMLCVSGFLLMAFDDAGSSEKPIGTFEADNGGKSQHLDCSGMPKVIVLRSMFGASWTYLFFSTECPNPHQQGPEEVTDCHLEPASQLWGLCCLQVYFHIGLLPFWLVLTIIYLGPLMSSLWRNTGLARNPMLYESSELKLLRKRRTPRRNQLQRHPRLKLRRQLRSQATPPVTLIPGYDFLVLPKDSWTFSRRFLWAFFTTFTRIKTTTARPETKDAASSLGSLAFYSVIVIGFTIALMA